jgi:hypothetical protein
MPRPRQERLRDIRSRKALPNSMYAYCRVVGCHNPATAGTTTGLDQRFCGKHAEHYSRHGSPYRASYSAADIAPHRGAAVRWLRANEDSPVVRRAVAAVDTLYIRAGHRIATHRRAGLPPEARARAIWATLRDRAVAPSGVLAVWLAVAATIHSDPQANAKPEFRRVQAAKLLHRVAGGEHKRWERDTRAGNSIVTQMHKHTHSRGRVLRHLGEQLEEAAAEVAELFIYEKER